MTATGGRACIACGAELEPGQEYCLECGARQAPPPRPQWRRPLVAAVLTVAVSGLLLLLGYERMRDDADSDSARAHSARGAAVKQAGASGPASGNGTRTRVAAAPLAVRPSP